jgi:hypothetical protein
MHPEKQQYNRKESGNRRHPEDGPEIVLPKQHQADRQQRAEEGTEGIERLSQAEGRPAQGWIHHPCEVANKQKQDAGNPGFQFVESRGSTFLRILDAKLYFLLLFCLLP